jgi:hypothetical protein
MGVWRVPSPPLSPTHPKRPLPKAFVSVVHSAASCGKRRVPHAKCFKIRAYTPARRVQGNARRAQGESKKCDGGGERNFELRFQSSPELLREVLRHEVVPRVLRVGDGIVRELGIGLRVVGMHHAVSLRL